MFSSALAHLLPRAEALWVHSAQRGKVVSSVCRVASLVGNLGGMSRQPEADETRATQLPIRPVIGYWPVGARHVPSRPSSRPPFTLAKEVRRAGLRFGASNQMYSYATCCPSGAVQLRRVLSSC